MAQLGAWIRTILVLAVVGNVVEWMLPTGSLRKYAGLVVGLVITVAILGPLAALVGRVTRAQDFGEWFRPAAVPSLSAVIARSQTYEVEAALDALPGVVGARVTTDQTVTRVQLMVAGGSRVGMRAAAQSAVEEVMSVPPGRVRVTLVGVRARRSGVGRQGGKMR